MGEKLVGDFLAGKGAEGTESGEKDSEKRKDLDADFLGVRRGSFFRFAIFFVDLLCGRRIIVVG